MLAQSKGMGASWPWRCLEQHALALWLPAAAATALAHNPNVLWVEPDAKRYASAETLPYGIPMVQAPQLSDAAAGEVLVCIIDSGYSGGHRTCPTGPRCRAATMPVPAAGAVTRTATAPTWQAPSPPWAATIWGSSGCYRTRACRCRSSRCSSQRLGLLLQPGGALNACKQGMSNRGFTRMVINMSLGAACPARPRSRRSTRPMARTC